ncbi:MULTISPECIES: DegT/DnrJ/EryC1/StrS aminotransferase family protein [unclassified Herbaspirillum]|uniref:DegT/DnrJ/EryC1/StrS family aminotransferase n=1 Tax=unclassified Herbaspirillum TaxID=2624150 RepID=UPI001170BB1C|nr:MULTISPECIES: DegT/DnrJ/EryC1/StrS family aminotransferase [unclassified Herbaspirillum]MBB5392528.1 dTDP-4-amino-4,6-dideoxygalactose transaminase [Herbaspirillum sp. SJZ102]TQK06165.1 dTDP-4-amino-4,6-dideoxygalactose transaminase [Herbaspirillum sp. SJZ130]TQK12357.1 dTDP-4-amino-4,6-dideoxygalactose transaminase [Herbaspirillum sp. SJZ106]
MSEPSIIEYESLAFSNQRFMADLEAAATRVIRSGWYVLGKEVSAFEAEFASYVGAKHCIGVANGLDALILSIEALELPAHSDILVASNTYIATILAIVRAGHKPVLVEPDPATFNIDPARLEQAMTSNTRAICVTHLFGKTCRMDAIGAFASAHGLRVIEDCAQSHGSRLGAQMTGTFGDAGCFSFYPTKNLGAMGDAGAITTNDDAIADRLRHTRNYGSKQKYVNRYVGINSRLDELQAALLRVKLHHLNAMTDHKRSLAEVYFANLPEELIKPVRRSDEYDVFHIYGIRHPRRDALRQYLLEHGVKTEIHYPIAPHRQEAMQGILAGDYSIAEELHATELSLPISVGHTADDISRVAALIGEFFHTAKAS